MNSTRKEMIPAPLRGMRKGMPVFCKPEWDLLCKIRSQIKTLILARPMRVADFRRELKGMLAGMDDTFNDWPEDPK